MRKCISRVLHLLILLGFATQAHAQTTWELRMEKKARFFTQEIMKALRLPDSLEPAIYKTNLWVSKSIDSLYAADLLENERKARMRKLFIGRDSMFKSMMTKRQFLDYDDWQREKWEKKRSDKKP